jgi:hypothetical protein
MFAASFIDGQYGGQKVRAHNFRKVEDVTPCFGASWKQIASRLHFHFDVAHIHPSGHVGTEAEHAHCATGTPPMQDMGMPVNYCR